MQAGAHAYITKGADFQEMLQAVRRASLGQRYISPRNCPENGTRQGEWRR